MALEWHGSDRAARVVVIDDDEDFRLFVETMLQAIDGFTVVGRTRPDIVVLDLQMPVVDGMTALPELRRLVPEARIVVVSAFPDLVTLIDVLDRGADLYLDKGRAWEEIVPALIAAAEASA
ncbi:MAG TPA: response regulator transcription factor [Acidimicrobiales bacterium]